jgi:quercetin dioxygenase-like cupin family protein
MTGMLERSLYDTGIAVIKVGTVHALVANTSDVRIAVITEGIVDGIASTAKLRQVEGL